MPVRLIDVVATIDIVLFFGVPLVLMICVFVQEHANSKHHR